MSIHELDGDLSSWPENPYELLGVSFGVLPRDLRRAYTRLIRAYKPEQHPEHFRRIRDAYETILQHVQIFGFGAVAPSEEDLPEETVARNGLSMDRLPPFEESSDEYREPETTDRSRHSVGGLAEELQELWNSASRGREEAVYPKLCHLSQRYPGSTEVCLRLYWLLALFPELDAERSPCDWLVAGLRANDLIGPLRELYRREIESDPAEALTERCAGLLQCPVPPGSIVDVAEWRWRAAGYLDQCAVIDRDLECLRPRFLREDEETWARLLFNAVDQLAWAVDKPTRELMQRLSLEIEEFEHLSSRLSGELDRFEFLREVSIGWHFLRTFRALPSSLVQLIPASWNRPFLEIRPLILTFMEWVVRFPHEALRSFDLVKRHASGVLAQFGNLLEQYKDHMSWPASDPEPSDGLQQMIFDFLDDSNLDKLSGLRNGDNLAALRIRLLDFCLREVIPPELVAQAVEDCPGYQINADEHLSGVVLGDHSLRYVCLAHRLFWA